jgi:hypothetical protein
VDSVVFLCVVESMVVSDVVDSIMFVLAVVIKSAKTLFI